MRPFHLFAVVITLFSNESVSVFATDPATKSMHLPSSSNGQTSSPKNVERVIVPEAIKRAVERHIRSQINLNEARKNDANATASSKGKKAKIVDYSMKSGTRVYHNIQQNVPGKGANQRRTFRVYGKYIQGAGTRSMSDHATRHAERANREHEFHERSASQPHVNNAETSDDNGDESPEVHFMTHFKCKDSNCHKDSIHFLYNSFLTIQCVVIKKTIID